MDNSNNENDYLCTFRFYDQRGRRVSIFARQVKEMMHVYVVTCSRKDNFKKDKARLIFEGREKKPIHTRGREEFVPLEGQKFKWAFMKWCKDNFYKPLKANFTYEGYILAKGYDSEKATTMVVGGLALKNVDFIIPVRKEKIV